MFCLEWGETLIRRHWVGSATLYSQTAQVLQVLALDPNRFGRPTELRKISISFATQSKTDQGYETHKHPPPRFSAPSVSVFQIYPLQKHGAKPPEKQHLLRKYNVGFTHCEERFGENLGRFHQNTIPNAVLHIDPARKLMPLNK